MPKERKKNKKEINKISGLSQKAYLELDKYLNKTEIEKINKKNLFLIPELNKNKKEEDKNILNYIIKHQEKNGEIKFNSTNYSPSFFLKTISNYLLKNKEDIKNYIKPIKKSIEYLENNLDHIYLLIINKDKEQNTYFSALENSRILNFSDSLSEILNEFDYTTEADKLFLLKGKLELGISRYFFNNENKILISKFYPDGKFKIATELEELKILNNHNINENYKKEIIEKNIEIIKKNKIKKINEIILRLNLIKNNNKELLKKIIEKNISIFEKFPEEIIDTKEHLKYIKISISINKKYNENYKKINKTNIAKNTNNINTIIKIIQLIN